MPHKKRARWHDYILLADLFGPAAIPENDGGASQVVFDAAVTTRNY